MKKVFVYGRGSTKDQELTLDNQEHVGKLAFDFMQAQDDELTYAGFFPDAAASSRIDFNKRLMGRRIMACIGQGDILMSVKLHRTFRSVKDMVITLERFNEMGVTFKSIDVPFDTESSEGRLMISIMTSFYQFEREQIAERTSDALSVKIRKGLPVSGICPIGWKKVGIGKNSYFEPDLTERVQVKEIERLRDKEGMTWYGIYENLRSRKIKPTCPTRKKKKEWSVDRIRKGYFAIKEGFPIYEKPASSYPVS